MALTDPPTNVPRVVDVQNPASGHYVVVVRVPTNLANKFPDKPWGTPIEDIGLTKADFDKYPGYTLVDVENIQGSPDLLWIFQKLDGPLWEERSKNTEELTPAKFRRFLTQRKTWQEVEPGTPLSEVGAIVDEETGEEIISSSVKDTQDTGKSLKVDVTETLDLNEDPLVGQLFDPKAAIMDVTEQLVAEETPADTGVNISQSAVGALGNGYAIKETQTARRRNTDGTTETGWPIGQTKEIGNESLIPAKFRSQVVTAVTKEQLELAAGDVDDIPDPPAPTGDEVLVRHQKVNDWRVEKTTVTEVIDEEAGPMIGELTDTWGINTTSEEVVPEGSAVDSGFGVKSSRVTPIGGDKSIKETENFPESPATLYGLEIDETTKIEVEIEKSLVSADTAVADARTKIDAGWCAEVQPIDKWHSILICSRIPDDFDGTEQTWKETQNISLPNELTEIGIIWDDDGDSNASFVELDNITLIEGSKLPWKVSAEAAAVASVVGRPYVLVKDGFSGAAEVTVTREFSKEPFTDVIEAHIFRPVRATITIKGMTVNHQGNSRKQGTGAINTGAAKNFRGNKDTNLTIIQVGPFEHNGITSLTETGTKTRTETASAWAGSTPGGGIFPSVDALAVAEGTATLGMPVSSIPLQPGDTFIRNVSVSPWRLGYWVREIYEAKIPPA